MDGVGLDVHAKFDRRCDLPQCVCGRPVDCKWKKHTFGELWSIWAGFGNYPVHLWKFMLWLSLRCDFWIFLEQMVGLRWIHVPSWALKCEVASCQVIMRWNQTMQGFHCATSEVLVWNWLSATFLGWELRPLADAVPSSERHRLVFLLELFLWACECAVKILCLIQILSDLTRFISNISSVQIFSKLKNCKVYTSDPHRFWSAFSSSPSTWWKPLAPRRWDPWTAWNTVLCGPPKSSWTMNLGRRNGTLLLGCV